MSSRLSKIDFFVVFMILLSLACLIGGFFLGANFSRSKAEAEFQRFLAEINEEESENALLKYSHTDFVSFYHQVYLPFKEFRTRVIPFLEHAEHSVEPQQLIDESTELRRIVSSVKKEIENAKVPQTSPLLQKSQAQFILALQAFEQSFQDISSLDKDEIEQVFNLIQGEAFLSGKDYWLEGQKLFYEALILWESFFVSKESPQFIENPTNYTLRDWSALSFHQKNDLIAKLLAELQLVTLYNPEDVAVYINSLAANSHQDKQQKVLEAVRFLSASDSIRAGEFLTRINEYEAEALPMIPLFSK